MPWNWVTSGSQTSLFRVKPSGREAGLSLRANPGHWQCQLGGNNCGAQGPQPGCPRLHRSPAKGSVLLPGRPSRKARECSPPPSASCSGPCQGSRPAWRTAGPLGPEEPHVQARESQEVALGLQVQKKATLTLYKSLPHPGS